MSPILTGSTFVRPSINIGFGNDQPDGLDSLPKLIEFSAKHNPDHTFATQSRAGDAPPVRITFSQLRSAVEHASAWLIGTGSTTGRTRRGEVVQPVALLLASDITIFLYLAALLRIGTPALILSARLSPVAIAHLLRKTSATCMIVNSQVSRASKEALTLLQSEGDDVIVPEVLDALSYEDFICDHPTLQGMAIPPRYDDYQYGDLDALILHSSGTTGLPKPIFQSQGYIPAYAANHGFPEQRALFRAVISTPPLYHGFGLFAPALSLSAGIPFVLFPASVIPTGKSTCAALQSAGARYLLSVPSILEEILQLPGGVGIEALKNLEIVAVGGAPIKERVGSDLAAAGVKLLNVWGTTEIGAFTPFQRIPPGYDWHYMMLRSDLGLKIVPSEDRSDTYCLIGRAPGWKQPHLVQDLIVLNPRDKQQVRVLGRADDLLVLATGEKVHPEIMESVISEHPDIKGVLAFGDGKLSLGLLIELAAGDAEDDPDRPCKREALLASIEPYLERGNSLVDQHGKVAREMVIFTRVNTKPLIRTDKGTLARKSNYAAFEEEITSCYAWADLGDTPFPSPIVENGSALWNTVRSRVKDIIGIHDIGDNVDLFEAGMDSLQANRLRQSIVNGLRVTKDMPKPVEDLASDFCFENSSVEKLRHAIARVMSGLDGTTSGVKEVERIAAMEAMASQYYTELSSYSDIAAEVRRTRSTKPSVSGQGAAVVLITGSTGSLGCFLLTRFASDPAVSKVICLNRPQSASVDVRQRQVDLMTKRGASLSSEAWEKVVLHGVEMSRPDFGLGKEEFAELLSVTHIIHNAWPVNFNRNLSSFEPHIKTLANLVRLSIVCAGTRPQGSAPTRLLFTSSVAVSGRFGILNPNGPVEVPEEALDAINTSEYGYPESKWVGERVIVAANELYGAASTNGEEALVHGSVVRIGQMTGAEGSGAWNENEYFPIIVRTSQHVNVLPALGGTLSWMPVNRAAKVVAELLFSERFRPFYHLENPPRQSCRRILQCLASILGGQDKPLPLVPFQDWLDRVRALGDDPEQNSSFKIRSFLENYFVTTATGAVTLGTKYARLDSPTMVRSKRLGVRHVKEYVAYWRKVGVMR